MSSHGCSYASGLAYEQPWMRPAAASGDWRRQPVAEASGSNRRRQPAATAGGPPPPACPRTSMHIHAYHITFHIQSFACISMHIHAYSYISMYIYAYAYISVNMHTYPSYLSISMHIHSYPCKSMRTLTNASNLCENMPAGSCHPAAAAWLPRLLIR